jgi:3-polyprenyl-4-hydroxybenzoate decarboxylase
MPISPPHYLKANTVNDLVRGYGDKLLNIIGVETTNGWKSEELD